MGGNLGNPLDTFQSARRNLSKHPQCDLIASSMLYQTPPIGPEGQEDYLNAVMYMHTSLAPLALLDLLQSIENSHGRIRKEHWGARTLDLDLIGFDDDTRHDERLTLPHSQMHLRQFVLQPLCDISPTWLHPQLNLTAAQLLQQCIEQGEKPLSKGSHW